MADRTCPRHPTKNRYRSQFSAIRAALTSSKRNGKAYRTYECWACEGWHITKWPASGHPPEEAHE